MRGSFEHDVVDMGCFGSVLGSRDVNGDGFGNGKIGVEDAELSQVIFDVMNRLRQMDQKECVKDAKVLYP